MNQKSAIIEAIGEESLLLPGLVERAVAANERAKYLFSLLQLARQQADHPEAVHHALGAERVAAGIDDPSLDLVVPGSVRLGNGLYRVPHLDRVLDGLRDALDAMIRPLAVRGRPEVDGFRARRESLAAALPARGPDVIGRDGIAALASVDPAAGDSLHLLVMDLHRALAGLVAELGCETVDGAEAYLLGDADRGLVVAFMRGLNRTAPLRFGHSGLATTAIRCGDRLLLQNDIGETGAHVLVVSVAESAVAITYTDVHAARLSFFRSLLDGWDVRWSGTVSRSVPGTDDGTCHLSVGRLPASDSDRCAAFLEHLGSRVVFLIDWNKARRQLRAVLSEPDAVTVLARAAGDEVGHRAFLELGGTEIIDEALAVRGGAGIDGPLDLRLGGDEAVLCLVRVLAVAAAGLQGGEPRDRVRERCRAEVVRAFEAVRDRLLDRCAAHAALAVESAGLLCGSVEALRSDTGTERRFANAEQARRIEREADLLVAADRCAPGDLLRQVLAAQDGAVDALEEACAYALLCCGAPVGEALTDVERLAGLADAASRSYIAALSAVRHEDRAQFLAEARRVADAAKDCDAARRRADETMADGRHDALAYLARTVATAVGSLAGAADLLGAAFARSDGFGLRAPDGSAAPVRPGPSPGEAPRGP